MKPFFTILVGALMLAGCSKHAATGARMDEDFRSAISADAQTIVYADLSELKSSELYRRHQDLLSSSRLDAVAQRTGLDPRRDLTALCLIWDGKHLVMLARGKFDAAKIEQDLVKEGAQRTTENGHTFIITGEDAVVFLPKGAAIAGETVAVKAELARFVARSGGIPEEMEQRMADVASNAQLWAVSRGGLPAASMPLRSDMDSILSNFASAVTGTSGGIRFDSGFHLLGKILCKSPAGAKRVNDAFRGLIGLARMSTKDNELDLLRMWDAVSISQDDQVVRVQADMPADLADKLIDKASALRGQLHAQ